MDGILLKLHIHSKNHNTYGLLWTRLLQVLNTASYIGIEPHTTSLIQKAADLCHMAQGCNTTQEQATYY